MTVCPIKNWRSSYSKMKVFPSKNQFFCHIFSSFRVMKSSISSFPKDHPQIRVTSSRASTQKPRGFPVGLGNPFFWGTTWNNHKFKKNGNISLINWNDMMEQQKSNIKLWGSHNHFETMGMGQVPRDPRDPRKTKGQQRPGTLSCRHQLRHLDLHLQKALLQGGRYLSL